MARPKQNHKNSPVTPVCGTLNGNQIGGIGIKNKGNCTGELTGSF